MFTLPSYHFPPFLKSSIPSYILFFSLSSFPYYSPFISFVSLHISFLVFPFPHPLIFSFLCTSPAYRLSYCPIPSFRSFASTLLIPSSASSLSISPSFSDPLSISPLVLLQLPFYPSLCMGEEKNTRPLTYPEGIYRERNISHEIRLQNNIIMKEIYHESHITTRKLYQKWVKRKRNILQVIYPQGKYTTSDLTTREIYHKRYNHKSNIPQVI